MNTMYLVFLNQLVMSQACRNTLQVVKVWFQRNTVSFEDEIIILIKNLL